jgi:hypothetical protein
MQPRKVVSNEGYDITVLKAFLKSKPLGAVLYVASRLVSSDVFIPFRDPALFFALRLNIIPLTIWAVGIVIVPRIGLADVTQSNLTFLGSRLLLPNHKAISS